MNVRLDYRGSGNSYSEHFFKFKVKISNTESGKRVNISFREKQDEGTPRERENGKPYASFSLPYKKARQLAHAMLTASAGDAEPIEFSIDEG